MLRAFFNEFPRSKRKKYLRDTGIKLSFDRFTSAGKLQDITPGNKPILNNNGFSLMEILLVLGSAAIIGTILVTIMVESSKYFTNQNTEINNNLSLNSISSEIQQGIQNASSINGSFTNGTNQYTTNFSTLIASIPALDASGDMIDTKFDTVVITQDRIKPNILHKYLFADPVSSRKNEDKILTSNLTYLQFVYLNDSETIVAPNTATRIDYVVKVAEKNGFNQKESSLSGRLNLKNV